MAGVYWLASYPKSGNTWLRVFLQNLIDDEATAADINRLTIGAMAASRHWLDEALGIESADLTGPEIASLRPLGHEWKSTHGGAVQFWKIHDAYSIAPDGLPLIGRRGTLGAIYIVRNPLDVCASFADFVAMPIDKMIDLMTDPAASIFKYGDQLFGQVEQTLRSWSGHVTSWTEASGLKRLVLRYEDMVRTPTETFTTAVRFLGLPDEPRRIAKAIEFSSFDRLQDQEQRSGYLDRPHRGAAFFRSGRISAWRDVLGEAQVRRLVDEFGGTMARFGYAATA